MKLTEKTLPEGIRLSVLAPFESELVTVAVAFHVGFAHETKEHLGIGHMVEHLCFCDNRSRTFPELRGAIERLGGSFNGRTGDTVTSFSIELLVDHWREGLRLLRDIAFQPRFDPAACAREVKVLLEETGQLRQRWLSWFYERGWFRSCWVLLHDKTWGPYMHGGRSFHRYADLKTDDLASWHRRYYRPENMAVVAVGRVDPRDVEEEVARCFGGLSLGPGEPIHHPEPNASAESTQIATRLGQPFWNQSVVAVGSWNNGTRTGERAVCDVAQEHLRHRAFDSLRLDHCLAYQTWCGLDRLRKGGNFLLGSYVKRGNEDQAVELLRKVLSQAVEEDMSNEELEGVRNMLLSQYARMNANPGWYAFQLTYGAFGEYPADIEDYPARLREVTPSQVREVLGRLSSERGPITIRQAPLLSVVQTVLLVAGMVVALVALSVWVFLLS